MDSEVTINSIVFKFIFISPVFVITQNTLIKQVCDYFDDEYGDQPDLTLGSLHETDSNYTGTPATDMVPTFPDSSSPERSDDATLNDSSNVLNDNFDAYSESANRVVSLEDTSEQSDHSEYNMCKNYKNSESNHQRRQHSGDNDYESDKNDLMIECKVDPAIR